MSYFAYASITSGKKMNVMEWNLEDTLTYKKIFKSFQQHFLPIKPEENYSRDSLNLDRQDPDGTLFIDLLTNPDAKHPKLDKIIETAPKGLVIVIQNMRALGNVDQIKEYYNTFKEKGLYILCFDNLRLSGLSEYSTSDFGFGQRNPIDEYYRAYELISELPRETKLPDSRGTIPVFSPAFIESYWKYETYRIPEDIAITASGIGRSAFHRKCALYEYSYDFQSRISNNEEQLSALMQLPKRFSKLPEKFDELERIIGNNWDNGISSYNNWEERELLNKKYDDICILLHIPTIHPVNYGRLKLRQAVGRKGIAAAYNYDENIIRAFEEYSSNPENNPNEFWSEYKKNFN